MTAELIFIGMDLLEQEAAKDGSRYLAEKCKRFGFSFNGISLVREDKKQVTETVKAGLKRSDLVFVCTKTGELLEGLPKTLAQEKGLILLPQEEEKMAAVLEERLACCLEEKQAGAVCCDTVKLCGLEEKEIREKIRDLQEEKQNPVLQVFSYPGEVHICAAAYGETKKAAKNLLKPVIRELKVRFGADIYTTEENKNLETAVVELLKKQDLTLTTVESCTGGALAARIINVPGASDVLKQGFVTYSNKAKRKAVKVKKHTLKKYGAVSEPCAREMAKGGAFASGADTALSVTGFAGPEGGTKEFPVGTVFIGCTVKDQTRVKECHFTGNRSSVREQAVTQALVLLRECILKNFEQKSGK